MAWDGTDNVSIGDPTKKSHYDQLLDNTQYLKDTVEEQHSSDGEHYMKHLRHILYPVAGNYNDLYKSGEMPYWFNQQGTGFGFGLEYPNGEGTHFWAETAQIEDSSYHYVGGGLTNQWIAQGFKVGQPCTISAIHLKMMKFGNPQKNNEPLIIYLLADNAGEPDEATILATFTTINGHSMASAAENWPITSNTAGAWYRIAGDTYVASANTQYYIAMKATGQDATNYFGWRTKAGGHNYAHGNRFDGDDGTPSNWTEQTVVAFCFMVETATATQLLQSGGQFDGKLVFNEGSPKNLSQYLRNDLKNMYSNEGVFTKRLLLQTIPASSTLFEMTMGDLGANRVRLYTDATPNVCLEVYESDGTKHAITDGTTDVTAGTYDIMFAVRHEADGSDFLKLLINGSNEGTQVSAQTITLDSNFANLATVITGGGFEAEPAWDKDFTMAALPSADGDTTWTTTTAATEASAMSVQNNKLYQNKAYYAVGNEDGYYLINLASMADATGFALLSKQQILSCVNTTGELGAYLRIDGDTNYNDAKLHEYYLESLDFKYQIDLMSKANLIHLCAKASDYFIFANGKLVIDGTGLFDDASGNTEMEFGDNDATASSDADVIYDKVLCYDAGPLLPSAADGLILHESAFWSADMTAIAALLYNGGTFKSVKELCGLGQNYVERIKVNEYRQGITEPTNTGTAAVLAEMEVLMIVFNCQLEIISHAFIQQDTDQTSVSTYIKVNGVEPIGSGRTYCQSSPSYMDLVVPIQSKMLCGLNKIEAWWISQDPTSTCTKRELIVKETQ